jgi:hypothetical protein
MRQTARRAAYNQTVTILHDPSSFERDGNDDNGTNKSTQERKSPLWDGKMTQLLDGEISQLL